MATTTISSRIQDIIGIDMDATLVPGYGDLVADGFNYIAGMIPQDSELWRMETKANTNYNSYDGSDPEDFNIAGKKILWAEVKYEGITDDSMPALQINYPEYLKGLNSNSIYHHGGSYFNPVFTFGPDGALLVSPDISNSPNGTLEIHYFKEFDGSSNFDVTTVEGYPNKAIYAGCLKAAHNLIMGRLSDATQDDEDLELVQLLQTQSQTIENQLRWETARLVGGKAVGEPE